MCRGAGFREVAQIEPYSSCTLPAHRSPVAELLELPFFQQHSSVRIMSFLGSLHIKSEAQRLVAWVDSLHSCAIAVAVQVPRYPGAAVVAYHRRRGRDAARNASHIDLWGSRVAAVAVVAYHPV